MSCPWPVGTHEEDDFPCGTRNIDIDSDPHIHSHVPGHILVNYIRQLETYTGKKIRLKDGNEAKELLSNVIEKWGRAHHKAQLQACLNCPKANWDLFANKVNEKLEKKELNV